MAQITEINVYASTSFNHPREAYANFKPSVGFRATVTDGENIITETKRLQDLAESLVQMRKKDILEACEDEWQAEQDAYRKQIERDGIPF